MWVLMIFIKRSIEIREHETCGFRDRKKKKYDKVDLFLLTYTFNIKNRKSSVIT